MDERSHFEILFLNRDICLFSWHRTREAVFMTLNNGSACLSFSWASPSGSNFKLNFDLAHNQ